jgi:hypothetical protein
MTKQPAKKATAKKAATKKPAAKSTARPPRLSGTAQVDAFLKELDHPFMAEVQAVRDIIKGVNPNITEEWKWRAPSFSYKGYLVTFNLWARDKVHLVFHNGAVLNDTSGFLQGDYPDRRMAYFAGMAEVRAKQATLEKLIRAWIKHMDAQA